MKFRIPEVDTEQWLAARTASSPSSRSPSSGWGMSSRWDAGVVSSSVPGELVEGKATWLERDGLEFELPDGHTAAWRDLHGKRCVSLQARGGGGGQYYVEGVHEDEERVLIHVGEYVWETGYGEGPPSADLPAGYPFPT